MLLRSALNANLCPGLYFKEVFITASKYGVCCGTILIPNCNTTHVSMLISNTYISASKLYE